ncbi:hypothetical protein IPJ72_04300 [Candidatus Peregrinibacteria bacterium]|nr:MAG: hypothetical protein IPJ72_04300 [Candidatus Peregrinibacteria bacterium]
MLFVIKHRLLDAVRDQVGNPLTFFGPDRPITRGEMAKLAIKTLEVNDAIQIKNKGYTR